MSSDVCRVCLRGGTFTSLFEKRFKNTISDVITSLTQVQIDPEDGLPSIICSKCLKKLQKCIRFIELCKKSDAFLRSKTLISYENQECNDDQFLEENNDSKGEESQTKIKNNDQEVSPKKTNVHKRQCPICGKIMSSGFRLKTHILTHSGEKPYSCPHCDKKFSQSENMKIHIRTHTGEKPISCSTCGARFAQAAGLLAHARKHTGQLPYACTHCPRVFRTRSHLLYHLRCHTGEKNFECETCGHAFITRGDLKQHSAVHTKEKHVCNVCGQGLSRISSLKRHMAIHSGVKRKQYRKSVKTEANALETDVLKLNDSVPD